MQISIIDTSSLGDRSYLIDHDGVAVVVDPQRDIDRVLALAADRGATITHVLETHIHNDYVTGGLELSRAVGAEYLVPAGDDVDYERRPARDGDIIVVGSMRLQVMHTPGHTHHHVSYILRTGDRTAVFSGGSMLHGTTGRTDLLDPDDTEGLTHAQYRSVRRLAGELPDDAQVYPTHGFGSFCSASPATGDSSTIGEQRHTNPALTSDEETYVENLLAGLTAYPGYYAHMGVINTAGPTPVDLSMPAAVDPAELRRRIDTGEWVVDLRSRTAFATGHLAGTLGFELSNSFVTYLGWLYQWGAPLTLIGDDEGQIADARRELVRIGIDEVRGAATGAIGDLSAGTALRSYRVSNFSELMRIPSQPAILDVRQANEYADSHLPGALNIPLHELLARVDEVPIGEIWVHCGSGYRASIAASILDSRDRTVVLIDDAFTNAVELGLAA